MKELTKENVRENLQKVLKDLNEIRRFVYNHNIQCVLIDAERNKDSIYLNQYDTNIIIKELSIKQNL